MSKNVTLKSIAARLGVSVSTVARSLRDGDRISPETVELVRKVADEMGYVRNLDGVKLRTGNSFVIMALLGISADDDVSDSGAVGLLHGIHKRLEETDYSVRVAPVFLGAQAIDQLKRVVAGRKADGIILDQTKSDDERVSFLIESETPFITFGRDSRCTEHAYFDLDNEQAAFDTTVGLIRAGARRIGLLGGDVRYQFVRQRMDGYKAALAAHDIAFDPAIVKLVPIEASTAKEAALDLIKTHKVDAINCVNELAMFGANSALKTDQSLSPRPIQLASVSGTNIGQYLHNDLLVAYYSRVQAGWELADLLLQSLQGQPLDKVQQVAKMEIRQY